MNTAVGSVDNICPKISEVPEPGTNGGTGMEPRALSAQ